MSGGRSSCRRARRHPRSIAGGRRMGALSCNISAKRPLPGRATRYAVSRTMLQRLRRVRSRCRRAPARRPASPPPRNAAAREGGA
jgi:hypothetical protein